MRLVGLTGNIASGKSEVARMFARLGATIIDADELAREVVRPGTPALFAIVARWGPDILNPDGTLDRARLRTIVFSDPGAREDLNAIVHPEVRRLRDRLVAEARQRGDRVVVSVIPLLYETGLAREFDRVIVVDAPEEVRLARLLEHRKLDAGDARRMMAAQMPAAHKRELADVVIDNAGTLEELQESVTRVWHALTA